jgi:hypothetical protein
MAQVILKNVSKVYDGNVIAVNKVNLDVDIADKEFMVIVGPFGCGNPISTSPSLSADLAFVAWKRQAFRSAVPIVYKNSSEAKFLRPLANREQK